jgi:hypothetical protein
MKRLGYVVLCIVVLLISSMYGSRVIDTGLDLTAGTDSIKQRFASGEPAKVHLRRERGARSLFVRADSPGTPECVTGNPNATLERRAGHDLTVDGTAWRRIYAVESSQDTLVTCRNGAEFAVGRDRHWDGMLLTALAMIALLLLVTGGGYLYDRRRRTADPNDAAAEE